jgi:hypothetical protein
MSLAIEDQESPQTRFMEIMGMSRRHIAKSDSKYDFPQEKENPMHRFKVIMGMD